MLKLIKIGMLKLVKIDVNYFILGRFEFSLSCKLLRHSSKQFPLLDS